MFPFNPIPDRKLVGEFVWCLLGLGCRSVRRKCRMAQRGQDCKNWYRNLAERNTELAHLPYTLFYSKIVTNLIFEIFVACRLGGGVRGWVLFLRLVGVGWGVVFVAPSWCWHAPTKVNSPTSRIPTALAAPARPTLNGNSHIWNSPK